MPPSLRTAAATAAALLALVPASAVRAEAPEPAVEASHGRLLLSVSDTADGRTQEVLLDCPGGGGGHPRAAEACADLDRSGGDMHLLSGRDMHCTLHYAPVTATVSGTWRGRAVLWDGTFPNACALERSTGAVFDF